MTQDITDPPRVPTWVCVSPVTATDMLTHVTQTQENVRSVHFQKFSSTDLHVLDIQNKRNIGIHFPEESNIDLISFDRIAKTTPWESSVMSVYLVTMVMP